MRGALALVGALERVVDDRGQRRREHHLLARELVVGAALQDEHGRGDPAAHDGHGEHGGEALLAEAGDVLEVLVSVGDGDGDGQEPLGDEARDALALPQVHAAHGVGREADVAAQGEHLPVAVRPLAVANVDAHDGRGRDERDIGAHARQHLAERARLARGLDQPEDPIQAAVGALVHLHGAVPLGGVQHHLRFWGRLRFGGVSHA